MSASSRAITEWESLPDDVKRRTQHKIVMLATDAPNLQIKKVLPDRGYACRISRGYRIRFERPEHKHIHITGLIYREVGNRRSYAERAG